MIRTSWPRSLALLAHGVLAALLAASSAAAQDTGVVSATVIDSSGQVVPGATVTLTNEVEGDLRTVTANERGEFSFRAVTPGSYTVKPDEFEYQPRRHRRSQSAAEHYNVLNAVEFQDVDRTARFDPAGNQIKTNFGTAIGISSPTRPPRVIQMSLRFSF